MTKEMPTWRIFSNTLLIEKKKCKRLDSSNFYALIFQSGFNCEGKTLKTI